VNDDEFDYIVVLIDFGKATTFSYEKQYKLTIHEQEENQCKYTHIAPEVISGCC